MVRLPEEEWMRGVPGASGTVRNAPDEVSDGPSPAAFTAHTRTQYSVPLVRPRISWRRSAGALTVAWRLKPYSSSSARHCTLYSVTAEPPSRAGSCHVTVIDSSPGWTARFRGTLGTIAGVADIVGAHSPLPTSLMALTRTKYSVPLTSGPRL